MVPTHPNILDPFDKNKIKKACNNCLDYESIGNPLAN